MACALDDIASMLEAELAQGTPLNAAIQSLLAKLFAEHMPIVFDGNGYSDEWLAEAEKRGLPNLKDTVAALAHYSDKDVMAVFERHGVLSPREMLSRQEILLENYTHSVSIRRAYRIEAWAPSRVSCPSPWRIRPAWRKRLRPQRLL